MKWNRSPASLWLSCLLALAGCARGERLVGAALEREANEIALALAVNGVSDVTVRRSPGRRSEWTVFVDQSDLVAARMVLTYLRLPKDTERGEGSPFDSAFIWSDRERRRNQELAVKCSELAAAFEAMPGVRSAHVIVPGIRDPYENATDRSEADSPKASVLLIVESLETADYATAAGAAPGPHAAQHWDEDKREDLQRFVAAALDGLKEDDVELLIESHLGTSLVVPEAWAAINAPWHETIASDAGRELALRFGVLYGFCLLTTVSTGVLLLSRWRAGTLKRGGGFKPI